MTVHKLFMGGAAPIGAKGVYDSRFFPQKDIPEDEYFRFDARRTPTHGGIMRRLVWKAPRGPHLTIRPQSPGLAHYLSENTIAQGDILQIILLPRRTELTRVWVSVENPLPGFTFKLRVRGNGLSGTPVYVTSADIDGNVKDEHIIDVTAVHGAPMYFKKNDMLELEITGLTGSIEDSEVWVTALLTQFEMGGN